MNIPNLIEVLFIVTLALLLPEYTNWLPKLAQRIIKLLAKHLPGKNQIRAAEWLAMLDNIPGKLPKLIYSFSFIPVILKSQKNRLWRILLLFFPSLSGYTLQITIADYLIFNSLILVLLAPPILFMNPSQISAYIIYLIIQVLVPSLLLILALHIRDALAIQMSIPTKPILFRNSSNYTLDPRLYFRNYFSPKDITYISNHLNFFTSSFFSLTNRHLSLSNKFLWQKPPSNIKPKRFIQLLSPATHTSFLLPPANLP